VKLKILAATLVAGTTATFVITGLAEAQPPAGAAPTITWPAPVEPGAIAYRNAMSEARSDTPTVTPTNRGQAISRGVQVQRPEAYDAVATLDEIPLKAPAAPKKPRKVFVYALAKGWIHSSIPITAYAVDQIGKQTGAWSTTISFNQSDFTAQNLSQYDVLVLDNTTGTFLDDPNDVAGTASRRKALLDFVRSGHGLVLTHAGTDSYHRGGESLWPEFTKMVGGHFKFHWLTPQKVTLKIDDPKSAITAPLMGAPFSVHDEIYTYTQDDANNRKNLHVLYSVDYSKMDPADKAIEPANGKRTDGDYMLSWIRREGQGRVFVQALGHNEYIWANPKMLESFTAGMQYAAGDLAMDDSPSAK
jgi:type 1 glutamine amidotransferase